MQIDVRRYGRSLVGSEPQPTEIFLSRRSLLQNLLTFSEGYVLTSRAATKRKHLQQELYFSQGNFTSTWFA